MSRVTLSHRIGDDFDRILEHLLQHKVPEAPLRIQEILEAIDVLEHNPLIGRPVAGSDLRELVIGRRSHGYIALYKYITEVDIVLVLAIRAQRESGFAAPPE